MMAADLLLQLLVVMVVVELMIELLYSPICPWCFPILRHHSVLSLLLGRFQNFRFSMKVNSLVEEYADWIQSFQDFAIHGESPLWRIKLTVTSHVKKVRGYNNEAYDANDITNMATILVILETYYLRS